MKQIISELKQQPVIAAVTVIGTALALFLIMVVVMLNRATVVPMAPETNRDTLIYATSFRGWSTDTTRRGMCSGGISQTDVDYFFNGIDGVKAIGLFSGYTEEGVATSGQNSLRVDTRRVNDEFFVVNDFKFLAGGPLSAADVSSQLPKAVISRNVAAEMFGEVENAVGRELELDDVPLTVCGVVEDVSPVADYSYAQVWMPLEKPEPVYTPLYSGSLAVALLPEKGADRGKIKEEILHRLDVFNASRREQYQTEYDFNGAPYDREGAVLQKGSNIPADIAKERRTNLLLYAILLLVPAINLSSMTRSRLAWQTGEIGVRRAFGATRTNIIMKIIGENFVITLIGGVLGLLLAIVFGALLFDAVYTAGFFQNYQTAATIGAEALFDWGLFAYALCFCFILNLISSGVPAWRASRMNPVDAINSSSKQ